MRLLVTGATGFLGRNFLSAIEKDGHDLLVVSRNPRAAALPEIAKSSAKIVLGSLESLEAIKDAIARFDPEACAHLAWDGIPNYSYEISKRNLDASLGLFDFLLSGTNCRRFAVTGSCFECGKTQGECLESDPPSATSFIAWAKISLLNYLQAASVKTPLAWVWLRLFYVYGEGQRSDSLLPGLVTSYLDGRAPDVRTPLNANDFVHVSDVAQALRRALSPQTPGGVYNVGTGVATPVLEICKMVERVLGVDGRHSDALAKKGQAAAPARFWANTKRLDEVLGAKPRVAIADGVARYAAFRRGNKEKIVAG